MLVDRRVELAQRRLHEVTRVGRPKSRLACWSLGLTWSGEKQTL